MCCEERRGQAVCSVQFLRYSSTFPTLILELLILVFSQSLVITQLPPHRSENRSEDFALLKLLERIHHLKV
jgi:hypothetical protein